MYSLLKPDAMRPVFFLTFKFENGKEEIGDYNENSVAFASSNFNGFYSYK
jgi:hypothetical protein